MDSALPLRWILVSFVRPPSNWLNGPFCTFQAAKHRWRKWSQCFHCHFLFHNLGGRKGCSSICSLHWLCCWHHGNQSRKPPIWCSVSILCLRPQAEVSGSSVRLSPAALRAGAEPTVCRFFLDREPKYLWASLQIGPLRCWDFSLRVKLPSQYSTPAVPLVFKAFYCDSGQLQLISLTLKLQVIHTGAVHSPAHRCCLFCLWRMAETSGICSHSKPWGRQQGQM